MKMYLYEAEGGFYKKTYKWHIAIVALIAAVILFGSLYFASSIRANKLRATNDRLTERLIESENTCTELTRELGRCQSEIRDCKSTIGECKSTIEQCKLICGDIEGISERSVTTARDAIEIIEETRYYVQCIEMELGYWDSDSIYSGMDNWLQSEGVDFVK